MEFRRLGKSGLKVSEIGLGCNNFGMRIEFQAAKVVVSAALDQGVTFFDTADCYGDGKSESMLGEILRGRRHDVVIATKFGGPMGPGVRQKGGSRDYMMRAVEGSLKRLGTDYIDLYQMHMPDPDTPIEETLRALNDLVTHGKVRYLGNSNFSGGQIADADSIARAEGFNRFIAAENHYNLLERGVETEVIPPCERLGLGLLPYFPLASGLLSGKYRRGEPPAEGTRLAAWTFLGPILTDVNFDRVEELTAYAEQRGHTILELAIAWLLSQNIVSSVIAGATKPEQVKANAAAKTWKLTPAEVTALTGETVEMLST